MIGAFPLLWAICFPLSAFGMHVIFVRSANVAVSISVAIPEKPAEHPVIVRFPTEARGHQFFPAVLEQETCVFAHRSAVFSNFRNGHQYLAPLNPGGSRQHENISILGVI